MPTFIKRRPDAPAGFFEAEAAGLAWLAEATDGVRVAGVIRVAPGEIELERIAEVTPTAEAADAFGAALARTHAAGAAAFGSPPEGHTGPLFIGRRPLTAARQTRWGRFYARDRVLPYLSLAVQAGTVNEREERVIRAACDRIANGDFDDSEPPARLHGDLWTGNVLWARDGAVLIDPAAHGGHRETDLAMLALFGCPFLERVLGAYDASAVDLGAPLRDGWRDRMPVHQLHPLAVHAAGHGRSYGVALADAAGRTLEL
ncbi:fructosamine kinase family protein [Conyzicola nivalis]|uniref:Fructosamine kinase n=1 Tax=Conyzicola nivalis TaxID=1477021 RepID=A0A916WFQ0_9MICO|nr:fructosamine kinase family protein [Conyzicola nivalis]GGA93041.1 fructosamine kinase [Conyzicola nivalis]